MTLPPATCCPIAEAARAYVAALDALEEATRHAPNPGSGADPGRVATAWKRQAEMTAALAELRREVGEVEARER